MRSTPSTGCPSPARRPRSNVGTTQARYDVCGSSLRGQSSRDSRRCGDVASSAASAAAVTSVAGGAGAPRTCACAHAHACARSGSAPASFTVSTASGRSLLAGRSGAVSASLTTTRHSHGVSRSPFAGAGV
ncbi:MAG: hypothetical protein E6J91_39325 [Deltaproteobacteria bacterium]|nr:MAG: hypothetical protein E6J91_39325 [Deltaproteobacteria bacterium]